MALNKRLRFDFSNLVVNYLLLASLNHDLTSHCLFFLNNLDKLFVLVYVDDIIVIGLNSVLINDFILALSASLPVKNLGLLHYFINIEVLRNNNDLFLC